MTERASSLEDVLAGERSPRQRYGDPAFRSTDRFLDLGRAAPLVRGPDGRQRCRWCHGPVPKGRISWCGRECVDDACIRTGRDVESLVRARDRGVCAICGLDTLALERAIREPLKNVRDRGLVSSHLRLPTGRNRWWEADHIVGVLEGGGCCGLAGYRTLCHWCHLDRTARQRTDRAIAVQPRTIGLFDQAEGANRP